MQDWCAWSNVDVSARIGGRLLQQVQRLFQLALRLIETTGFAVQHGHIVMQRGQASVGGEKADVAASSA